MLFKDDKFTFDGGQITNNNDSSYILYDEITDRITHLDKSFSQSSKQLSAVSRLLSNRNEYINDKWNHNMKKLNQVLLMSKTEKNDFTEKMNAMPAGPMDDFELQCRLVCFM